MSLSFFRVYIRVILMSKNMEVIFHVEKVMAIRGEGVCRTGYVSFSN